jgi:hypothetical protein
MHKDRSRQQKQTNRLVFPFNKPHYLGHKQFNVAQSFLRSQHLCSASQQISCMLRNAKVHYRVNKSPPLFSYLSHMNSVHIIPPYFSKIHFNIILPSSLAIQRGSFPLGFPNNILYAFITLPCLLHAQPVSPSLMLSS